MTSNLVWLAAHYAFPATYSCRIPLSSMSSALAAPGPGPGTVRLALIRAGCEVFGPRFVRDELFPLIRVASIHVRPPERLAFSQHLLRGYKARQEKRQEPPQLVASLLYREVAQAQGVLTIYIQIPSGMAGRFRDILLCIGYWGQTDSLAMCNAVEEAVPDEKECTRPLHRLPGNSPLGTFFICPLTEFRSPTLTWEEIAPDGQEGTPLRLEVYGWPMALIERSAQSKWLVRRPFIR